MSDPEILEVDPTTLRLPPSRASGADPAKLQRPIARHGKSTAGMPRVFVYRTADEMVTYDGVTRATRVAKLLPGQTITVQGVGRLSSHATGDPTVGDRLP